MFPNVPNWSKKIDHKFNRMAFITRFNLVLVWSKIVQLLLKSHPNWSGITRSPGLVIFSSLSQFQKIFFNVGSDVGTPHATGHSFSLCRFLWPTFGPDPVATDQKYKDTTFSRCSDAKNISHSNPIRVYIFDNISQLPFLLRLIPKVSQNKL